MPRHLMILALCIETGLVVGGGVVVGQLWIRSGAAERRTAAVQELLRTSENELQTARESLADAQGKAAESAEQLRGTAEQVDQQETRLAEYQTSLMQLEAQNEEFAKAAEQATALSDEVAELKSRLQLRDDGAEASPDSDELVRVRPEEQPAIETTARSASTESVTLFDDRGWTSAVDRSAPVITAYPYGVQPPYSVFFPPPPTIPLPEGF